jgi:hypothetical protein
MSRNNDIDGYWGIGVLCKSVLLSDRKTVKIDLLNSTLTLSSPAFSSLLDFYCSMLDSQLFAYGIPKEIIASATVKVKFDQKFQNPYLHWRSAFGNPCVCECEICDDKGHVYVVVGGTYCYPHDPKRERRSNRAKNF